MKKGKVYIVGAGPGDPGLITVKGMECLRQAEVVVYDRLIDDSLLDEAADAEKIYVGKGHGCHVREQKEINLLLVAKAKENKTVVRLKGGDPFVLGRGGEEAETLAANGIPFEIVPGITSATAVPAYAGIPVTDRRWASSFTVVTGHEGEGKEESSINWDKVSVGSDTLVILMGMANLRHIVGQLIQNGRSPSTLVAVVKQGTSPGQRTVVGTLEDIAGRVEEAGLEAPAVIVIGEVVNLREKLRWFESQPIFGKRVLVTRAEHQASDLSRLLLANGAQPVELPVIRICPPDSWKELDGAARDLKSYGWVIFTSVNGVEMFFERLHALKLDARQFCGIKVGAMGPATAGALEQKGICPDYVPDTYTSEGFVSGLKNENVAEHRVLLPRADIAGNELIDGLKKLGAEVHQVVAYRTVPVDDTAVKWKQILGRGEVDVITFTSASTVRNLVAILGQEREAISKAVLACIGPVTAEALAREGMKADVIASEHTIGGLVEAIERYFQGKKGGTYE